MIDVRHNKDQRILQKILSDHQVVIISITNVKAHPLSNGFKQLIKLTDLHLIHSDLNRNRHSQLAIDQEIRVLPTVIVYYQRKFYHQFVHVSIEAILDQILEQMFDQFIPNETSNTIMKKIYGIGHDVAGYKYQIRSLQQIANEYLVTKQQIKNLEKNCLKILKNKANHLKLVLQTNY